MAAVWDVLNKIAIIGTIVGIPATIIGIIKFFNGGNIVYDMYKEPNSGKGDTVLIGEFSKRDCRKGKKENPNRQYHKKDLNIDNENNWV